MLEVGPAPVMLAEAAAVPELATVVDGEIMAEVWADDVEVASEQPEGHPAAALEELGA